MIKKIRLKRRAITWLAATHYFGNPGKNMKIVGVTGTNGKTTTVTLLYRIAMALGHKAGLVSTVENIVLDEKVPATHTTPDPVSLHKLLKRMEEKGCEYAFMEVSSHAMHQDRVAGVTFAGGIFTNLTHDHMDYHKNFENYFRAKRKFFRKLPRTAFAISNADDEYGMKITKNIKAKTFSYGIDNDADFTGTIRKMNQYGLEMDINGEKVSARLLGKFNAYNILSVWSACQLLGFDMGRVKSILESIEPPRGRFDHFTTPKGVLVVIDYAHTPDALEKIIGAINEVKPWGGRLISVFGCGGDRDPLKRPKMGEIGARLSDVAIFTSDNPRSEDPEKIIDEMKVRLSAEELDKTFNIPDRREAIRKAVETAEKGDIILCAGKGHEDYQEIRGVKHHFNDLEEFKKLL